MLRKVVWCFVVVFCLSAVIHSRVLAATADGSKSSLTTNPSTLSADGSTRSTVTVTLRDSGGNAIGSGAVSLAATNGASVDQSSISLGSSGIAVFTVRSSTVGTSTVTVTLDGTAVSNLSGQIVFNTPLTPTNTPTPTPLNYCGDAAPNAPSLVSAVSSGAHQITLTWEEPASPVSYYLLSYGQKSGSYIYGNPNVGAKGTTTYTVGNLATGTTYYFAVRAVNGCMSGAYSNERSAKAGVAATPTEAPEDDAGSPGTDDGTTQNMDAAISTSSDPEPSASPEPLPTESADARTGSDSLLPKIVIGITVIGVCLGIVGGILMFRLRKQEPGDGKRPPSHGEPELLSSDDPAEDIPSDSPVREYS